MGHADNDFVDSGVYQGIKRNLESNDERFTALDTKALHCVEFACKELLELISPYNSIIVKSTLCIWDFIKLGSLNLVTDPIALLS